jgi:hypothetical protein
LPRRIKECHAYGVTGRILGFVAILCCLTGCRASVNAQAHGRLDTDVQGDIEATSHPAAFAEPERQRVAPSERELAGKARPSGSALLGARHDLRPAESVTTPVCSCLIAVVGQPGDPRLRWLSTVPVADPQSQLVIALTSLGLACENEPADSLGASYWGYRARGEDVVVVVEPARFGRPVTTGAIVPKPTGAGRILIEPLDAKTPYGRPLDGSVGACRVWP